MNLYSILLLVIASSIMLSCQGDSKPKSMADQTPLSAKAPTPPKVQQPAFGVDYIMGKFDPAKHPDFAHIDLPYADREGRYMRKEAYEAYRKMYEAAKADGITLTIRSAARNFDYQKGIWERKWKGTTKLSDGTNAAKDIKMPVSRALKILQYSSMPGTSRHHWGTDIDINSFNNSYFDNGKGLKEYKWLTSHAPSFGFVQVYTAFSDLRPSGYNEEKWHWTYRPISRPITLEAKELLQDQMIKGFAGDMTPTEINVVSKYVLGISPECLAKD